LVDENKKLARGGGTPLEAENVRLRKSMGNWEDWIRKYQELENKLTLASTECERLRS